MIDCQFIIFDKVKEITDYWRYGKDTPKYFREDCKKLFDIDI
jgi:hypothetical protein